MLKVSYETKAKIRNLTLEVNIDSNKVFINESLCRYYKFLWNNCKKLWTEEWIEAFSVSNG